MVDANGKDGSAWSERRLKFFLISSPAPSAAGVAVVCTSYPNTNANSKNLFIQPDLTCFNFKFQPPLLFYLARSKVVVLVYPSTNRIYIQYFNVLC